MNLPPKRASGALPSNSQEAALRCERCGAEMAPRAVALAEMAAATSASTQATAVNMQKQPTVREIITFFWRPRHRPTRHDYMIAGKQTIRL